MGAAARGQGGPEVAAYLGQQFERGPELLAIPCLSQLRDALPTPTVKA